MFSSTGKVAAVAHGTGTEDYFNTRGPRTRSSSTLLRLRASPLRTGWLGRTHVYRFHVSDPCTSTSRSASRSEARPQRQPHPRPRERRLLVPARAHNRSRPSLALVAEAMPRSTSWTSTGGGTSGGSRRVPSRSSGATRRRSSHGTVSRVSRPRLLLLRRCPSRSHRRLEAYAVRDEIAPARGRADPQGVLVLGLAGRGDDAVDGRWVARCRSSRGDVRLWRLVARAGVASPARSVLARLVWLDTSEKRCGDGVPARRAPGADVGHPCGRLSRSREGRSGAPRAAPAVDGGGPGAVPGR